MLRRFWPFDMPMKSVLLQKRVLEHLQGRFSTKMAVKVKCKRGLQFNRMPGMTIQRIEA